jgi:hypothetical protein
MVRHNEEPELGGIFKPGYDDPPLIPGYGQEGNPLSPCISAVQYRIDMNSQFEADDHSELPSAAFLHTSNLDLEAAQPDHTQNHL